MGCNQNKLTNLAFLLFTHLETSVDFIFLSGFTDYKKINENQNHGKKLNISMPSLKTRILLANI